MNYDLSYCCCVVLLTVCGIVVVVDGAVVDGAVVDIGEAAVAGMGRCFLRSVSLSSSISSAGVRPLWDDPEILSAALTQKIGGPTTMVKTKEMTFVFLQPVTYYTSEQQLNCSSCATLC